MPKASTCEREEKPAFYYDQIYQQNPSLDHMAPVYDVVLKMLSSIKSPIRILEIGCGIGIFGALAVASGFRYGGFDFSQEAIRRCPNAIRPMVARRNVYNRSTFRVGYTVIVAIEVMEHLEDLEVVNMIAPDTICIFTLPNFTDEAHLRVYEDEKAIRKYYKGMIRWHRIESIVMAKDLGIDCGKKIIHVCKGIKL